MICVDLHFAFQPDISVFLLLLLFFFFFAEAEEMFPIHVFNRSDSSINAVVGGPLYRGKLFPTLQGHLLYGDYITG